MSDVCPCCCKAVPAKCRALQCDHCNQWIHFKCSSISVKLYNHLTVSNDLWLCSECKCDIFPFMTINNLELFKLSFNSNTTCLCSNKIARNFLDTLPRLEVISKLNNIPNLSNFDVERNLTPQVNFDYYSIHDFHSREEICHSFSKNSFSTFHCNIRSLAANYDNLITLLSELHYPFNVIGLSETKIKVNKDQISNTSIPSYDFISQPSLQNAGGVGFYVKNDIIYHTRDDLTSTTEDYESLWIEIDCKAHCNIVCAIVYRHPNSNLEKFSDYLIATVDKISKENKYCILMGDFNINLLNFETHPSTEEFINALGSYCFQPHIIQPTRITDHSATLIDNIFFNSLDHHTVSGNLLYDITDHLPNFLVINKLSNLPKKLKMFRRDYSNFKEQDLIKEVQSIDWADVLPPGDDVNLIFDSFHSCITNVINNHIPLKLLSKKEVKILAKPWITAGLRASIASKNKLFKSYLRSKSEYHFSKFKTFRNKLKHLLNISKKEYYNQFYQCQ